MKNARTRPPTVKVVDKTLALLEEIASSEQGYSLTDLATRLDMPNATVFRLLQHLVRRGYVEQDSSSKLYFLGLKVLVLRTGAIRTLQLAARARPFLRDLSQAAGYAAHLAVYRDGEVVYIDRVDTPHTVGAWVPIGMRAPASVTALGKVLLAALPAPELDSFLSSSPLPQRTPHSITDPAVLRDHLRLVRERGYAQDMQEASPGVWCIAAPVRDYSARVVAAVSISARAAYQAEETQTLILLLQECALRVSCETGFRPQTVEEALGLHTG